LSVLTDVLPHEIYSKWSCFCWPAILLCGDVHRITNNEAQKDPLLCSVSEQKLLLIVINVELKWNQKQTDLLMRIVVLEIKKKWLGSRSVLITPVMMICYQ